MHWSVSSKLLVIRLAMSKMSNYQTFKGFWPQPSTKPGILKEHSNLLSNRHALGTE